MLLFMIFIFSSAALSPSIIDVRDFNILLRSHPRLDVHMLLWLDVLHENIVDKDKPRKIVLWLPKL
jgi:hypothetical protein